MKQLLLDLPCKAASFSDDRFIVSSCNSSAYMFICNHSNWPHNRMLLIGEEGSGKTHLANIWSNISNAEYISPSSGVAEVLGLIDSLDALILEDIDDISDELLLFQIINHCYMQSKSLLMTSRHIPKYSTLDLESRIRVTHKAVITKPDSDIVRVILDKWFISNQINISDDVIAYLSMNAPRDFASIYAFLEGINIRSLEEKRNITIPFIKRVLENVY